MKESKEEGNCDRKKRLHFVIRFPVSPARPSDGNSGNSTKMKVRTMTSQW